MSGDLIAVDYLSMYEDFWSKRDKKSLHRNILLFLAGDCRYLLLIKSFYCMTLQLVEEVLILLIFC